jgi:hypothetical protein
MNSNKKCYSTYINPNGITLSNSKITSKSQREVEIITAKLDNFAKNGRRESMKKLKKIGNNSPSKTQEKSIPKDTSAKRSNRLLTKIF